MILYLELLKLSRKAFEILENNELIKYSSEKRAKNHQWYLIKEKIISRCHSSGIVLIRPVIKQDSRDSIQSFFIKTLVLNPGTSAIIDVASSSPMMHGGSPSRGEVRIYSSMYGTWRYISFPENFRFEKFDAIPYRKSYYRGSVCLNDAFVQCIVM